MRHVVRRQDAQDVGSAACDLAGDDAEIVDPVERPAGFLVEPRALRRRDETTALAGEQLEAQFLFERRHEAADLRLGAAHGA